MEQFSLGDVTVSFSHGHGEKDMTEGGVNESGGNVSYKSMKTMKMKERQSTFRNVGKCES